MCYRALFVFVLGQLTLSWMQPLPTYSDGVLHVGNAPQASSQPSLPPSLDQSAASPTFYLERHRTSRARCKLKYLVVHCTCSAFVSPEPAVSFFVMAPLSNVVTFSTQLAQAVSTSLLQPLPNGYNTTSICHVNRHSLDVLPGTFNRTVWQSPWNSSLVQDEQAKREIERIANTPFIAYDEKFLSIVGRNPKIDKIMELDQHIHEGPSYIPTTNQLFFTEWGEGETVGGFAQHPWQYWLDLGAVDEDPNNIKVGDGEEKQRVLKLILLSCR